MRKPLILNAKYYPKIINPHKDRRIKQAKKYFILETNKERYYNGKRVLYARKDESDKLCWIKFMFGSEKFHSNTTKIDMNRVSRSNWIFEVLDYLSGTIHASYDTKLSIYPQNTNREIIEVHLEDEIYKIVLEHISYETVLIITAYPIL